MMKNTSMNVISNTFCDKCKLKRKTWSDKLAKDGYIGCAFLISPYHTRNSAVDDADIDLLLCRIKAETVGTGWITNGVIATNDQIIVREVNFCPYKEE